MRLAKFINSNVKVILAEWETFAGGLPPGGAMTVLALRDDAEAILLSTARDMQVDQSLAQQARKSKGHGGARTTESGQLDNASARHGKERVDSGFNIIELVSEYRALRASVLRLWRANVQQPDLDDIDDLTRFNESLDQSLAKAVGSYSERIHRSRNLFLAILGHDLRAPLHSIRVSAELVSRTSETRGLPTDCFEKLAVIGTDCKAMDQLISDLLDFSSTWLGGSMQLILKPLDLKKLCCEVVDTFRTTHPQRTLHFRSRGNLTGHWDAARLRQVLSNLLGNALQHGSPKKPVELSVASSGSTVVLRVHNKGAPIRPKAMPTLFDPLVRHATVDSTLDRTPGSIGLGLYIVREIVKAKGGKVEVASTARQGTTFTVRIPRQVPPLERTVAVNQSRGSKRRTMRAATPR